MMEVGLGFLLPLLVVGALILFGPWTDRKGWTRTKGKGTAMAKTALQGWNLAVYPEMNAAVEYQKQCHDEEDQEGKKRRPHFPGVTDGSVTVRPLQDTPEDVACLCRWLGASDLAAVREAYLVNLDEFQVPCMVEEGGEAVGYLQFAQAPHEPGVYQIDGLLGPGCDSRRVRPLLAYLYEIEGASRVVSPGLSTDRPADSTFHLLH